MRPSTVVDYRLPNRFKGDMKPLSTASLFRVIDLESTKENGLVFFCKADKALRKKRLGIIRGPREE